jgi:Heterokaryon incompatibility protein (HET)
MTERNEREPTIRFWNNSASSLVSLPGYDNFHFAQVSISTSSLLCLLSSDSEMLSNQSRSRSDSSGNALDPQESFSYSPLDPNIDCIRLTIIEPAKPYSAVISCRLQHVTFAQQPKYQALSYAWGDQSVEERILLDGKLFEVGRKFIACLEILTGPS